MSLCGLCQGFASGNFAEIGQPHDDERARKCQAAQGRMQQEHDEQENGSPGRIEQGDEGRAGKEGADRLKVAKAVRAIPEVVEFYRMAGDVDYLLKVQVGSVQDYDRVYRTLISRIDLADVSATFAMECIKNTTELPL